LNHQKKNQNDSDNSKELDEKYRKLQEEFEEIKKQHSNQSNEKQELEKKIE